MLELEAISAGYGKLVILRDVGFHVRRGETIGIFGRNGAGKSTLVNAVVGLVHIFGGLIRWEGRPIHRERTEKIVQRGVSLVPQTRGLFKDQTVLENLTLACFGQHLGRGEVDRRVDEVFTLFRPIAERRRSMAASLSGGEQQMLAIGKALMRKPRLLLLDEPSIGLAPRVVDELAQIVRTLRGQDLAFVITEQNVGWVLPLVDRAFVLDQGTVAQTFAVDIDHPLNAEDILAGYLGDAAGRTF